MVNLAEIKSKPDEVQVGRFWEYFGFKHGATAHKSTKELGITLDQRIGEHEAGYAGWYQPDGKFYGWDLPPIDLNSLFRYAVTKTDGCKLVSSIDRPDEFFAEARLCNRYFPYSHKDPALALFWAIWEAINGKQLRRD